MASHSELTLDCKPRSFSMLLKSFGEQTDQTNKLEEFLSLLEGERLKIDAFKRELPLCMHLLTNAMEASRQQLQAFRSNQCARPVLEEFMPIKHSNSEGPEKTSDKANWMTTAQLWSQASEAAVKPQSIILSPKELDIGFNVSSNQVTEAKHRNGGAFLPFSKDRNSCAGSPVRALPELGLAPSEQDTEEKNCSEPGLNGVSCPKRETFSKGGTSHSDGQTTTATTATSNTNTSSQPHRKARRCWSPDLHRRFVNALQMLGGSQVATPKQIRELMKVDGLTNDEVKSHLQKYRLHTRRPSPSPQATGGPGPQLVVLGGIWVPPEYATAAAAAAAHNGTPTIYTPHPASHAAVAPPHYCAAATPVPQEFYTAASQQPPLPPPSHHLPLHHQVHMFNKATSQAHSSPEYDIKGGGDRSESIEDDKSDSSSWKNESGENEGGRKGLASLREEGEESNGSEITLKF